MIYRWVPNVHFGNAKLLEKSIAGVGSKDSQTYLPLYSRSLGPSLDWRSE